MPPRLQFKLCPFCGAEIYGRKRTDRKGYHYSPRCADCAYKVLDATVMATKLRGVKAAADKKRKPIGSTRPCKRGEQTYVLEKTEGGWDYQHRVRTEALPGEHVHHRDEDGQNNAPDNLRRMDANAHRQMHRLAKRLT
jgi:hypothetical protein